MDTPRLRGCWFVDKVPLSNTSNQFGVSFPRLA